MSMSALVRALLVLAVPLAGVPVRAEVIPGRWEKLEQQRQNLPLIITLRSGERLKATYQGTTLDALLLRPFGGGETQIPKTDVLRIETVVGDGVGDGVLWGAGIAFGVVALGAVISCAGGGPCEGSEGAAGQVAVGGPPAAAIGALLGLVIDGVHKKREVLYQAPQEAPSGNP